MEPLLHGATDGGDLVLVDKTAYWFTRPARYDLVVVRGPADGGAGHLVKRLVAWGDDRLRCVRIRAGDLELGATGQTLRIHVKDPLAADDMRVTHFAYPELGAERIEDYFADTGSWRADRERGVVQLEAGAPRTAGLVERTTASAQEARRRAAPPDRYLPGFLSTARPVDTTYLDHAGERDGVYSLHRDIGMELTIRAAADCRGLLLVLEYHETYFTFEYGSDGAVEVRRMGEVWRPGADPAAAPGRGPSLGADPVRLVYGYLDGRLFLIADDTLLVHWALELETAGPPPSRFGDKCTPNLLHIAAAGGGVEITALRTFHDLFHQPLGVPAAGGRDWLELPPGGMFLLGDNSRDSRDSRTGRTYPEGDLVGQPVAIVAPPRRVRWLR